MLKKGWVKNLRKQKQQLFIDVSDGSCLQTLQVVASSSLTPEGVTFHAAVEVHGEIVKSPHPLQPVELKADDIKVTQTVQQDYPFKARLHHPAEYLRNYLHLRPKTSHFASLLRVRDAASVALHDFFHQHGFVQIHTPLLTGNDCEGAGEVFVVKAANEKLNEVMKKDKTVSNEEAFFEKKTYLTVSGQLHLEAVASGLSKVYTFGPTFRAENSRTTRHLSEFYMIEAELAFMTELEDLLCFLQKFVKSCTTCILDVCEPEVALHEKLNNLDLTKSLQAMIKSDFIVMSYKEVLNILELNKKKLKTLPAKSGGLGREHELCVVQHTNGVPVFVVDWPAEAKPFYMRRKHEDSTLVSAVDLLVPEIGELCGGSLREHSYEILEQHLTTLGLKESLKWYLDLRKFGSAPSGGFGLGFERYLQYILGIPNIKDTIPFPRWPHHCHM